MLPFSLTIFVGTSVSMQDFDASRLKVSLSISYFQHDCLIYLSKQ